MANPLAWQAGEAIPLDLAAHIRERLLVAGIAVDGDILTAQLAERVYPKAEYLARRFSVLWATHQHREGAHG